MATTNNKSVDNWEQTNLANLLKEAFPKGRFNLYRDLLRAMARGEWDGTITGLNLIAHGYLKCYGISVVKTALLREWLENNLAIENLGNGKQRRFYAIQQIQPHPDTPDVHIAHLIWIGDEP
jgi:hypothetical protein